MTDEDDHPALKDNHPIDSDYIDPPSQRADISTTEEDPDDVDFSEVEGVPSSQRTDVSYRFLRDGSGLGGTEWDHEIDMNAPREHDGRASTRTGFDPRESQDPEKWSRLAGYQEDRWSDKHETTSHGNQTDQRRFLDMFSSQLEISGHQERRAEMIIGGINVGHMAHYPTEVVILAVISIVANEDGRWIRDERKFHELLRGIGATQKDVRSCRQLVKSKSELL